MHNSTCDSCALYTLRGCCRALTLVPLVYTAYLVAEQAASMSGGSSRSSPSYGESDLLVSLGGDAPYNPCNPNNVYCSTIPVSAN